MWAVILFAIVVVSILLVIGIKKITHGALNGTTRPAKSRVFDLEDSNSMCYNEDLILQIQRDQWAKAKVEIFGSDQAGFHGSDMEFYKKSFGLVDITLPTKKRGDTKPITTTSDSSGAVTGTSNAKATTTTAATTNNQRPKRKPRKTTSPPQPIQKLTKQKQQLQQQYSHLIYYRIYKNANDYIRNLLTEYVYYEDDHMREFASQNCYAIDQHCVHRFVHYFTPSAVKSLYVQQRSTRYAFTFIREPIDRFISAMTEIEYRSKEAQELFGLPTELPFQHPLGSQMRFQEFIKMILSTGGSRTLFRNLAKFEVIHIVPTIPTLILAAKVEGKPLKTYRVEEFDRGWESISNSVGIPVLNDLHRNRTSNQKLVHPSSQDFYNTTLAAKSFLSHASIDSFKRFGEKLSNRQRIPPGYAVQDYQQLSKTYLKALCRVYLIDYMCLNYSLPADCQDLQVELMEVVDDYWRYHSKSNVVYIETLSDMLRLVLPRYVMERLSVAACLFSPTPECEARFTHGVTVLDVVDRHEEL